MVVCNMFFAPIIVRVFVRVSFLSAALIGNVTPKRATAVTPLTLRLSDLAPLREPDLRVRAG